MDDANFHVPNPPIIEAIVDLDCDVPPTLDLAALEAAGLERYGDRYPTLQKQAFYEQNLTMNSGTPTSMLTRQGLQALRFLAEDKKQLVQIRAAGYSFNRLAPYGRLDDYLPEVERTWGLYVDQVKPLQVRTVRLRYINRIHLPFEEQGIHFEKYLAVVPLPEDEGLTYTGFLTQHTAVDNQTKAHVRILLSAQAPKKGKLPVILDNCVELSLGEAAENWASILDRIILLRRLKNRVFRSMLTKECLDLFQ